MSRASSQSTPAKPTDSTSAIQLDRITRRFGTHVVLNEVTLEIRRGELFGLLGPSGSGKTTLIKLITGIDAADQGSVYLLGKKMPKRTLLGHIGYMAQADALYTELTAQENLLFFASLYGLSGTHRQDRMQAVMNMVGLLPHLEKRVSAYSGGMKRRLSLAIALLHEPEVLILDEPTVGIDPVLRQSIWRELLALRDKGITILLTTHVMDEADKCDRLGLIREGALTAVGSPEALKRQTETSTIEEAFIALGGGARA